MEGWMNINGEEDGDVDRKSTMKSNEMNNRAWTRELGLTFNGKAR